ncbi:alkaline phosphatase family protein [Dactylosporangium aurantiacum]|uniref:Alkaline phosphatase family protein n=1 Tax=Dactylosporangium aurantiacum TaxID=35754 RepID=A0A9Q9IH93_9ACTN|nr:alkaline phosphatase D family protein [Dactylosporangium aurantiacum]MDG6104437.1 alkaline phosphatase D family protein [Dactylosporangium aurantiacum]UWZ56057.1 alkaline phosphatase family protein [Dactylosporangium aurantiacum]
MPEDDSSRSLDEDRGPLLLGPVLRRVEGDRATIWVETSHPATVEVDAAPAGGSARTFTVHGHHYALVVVSGLPQDAVTPYRVRIDGDEVWPLPGDTSPPSAIRTRPPGAPVRLIFGSCRESSPLSVTRFPPDALDAYAGRLIDSINADAPTEWPDMLVLLGDQVYADETPEKIQKWLGRRKRRADAPKKQVVDFHEYTKLYLDSWGDPEIRWLLSTVPSVMIFDDHEIIDDWNTSDRWRAQMQALSWWEERIRAGLSSYWVYQHLGNIAPSALDDDRVWAAVRAAADDATEVLDAFGTSADHEPTAYRWSYTIDIDRTRLVVVDNRAARRLERGHRAMLQESEWKWFTEQLPGDYDHLLIGSSLPWLLPPAIHHLEAATERLAESHRDWVSKFGEKLRQAVDLEHWAAFKRSFDALTELLSRVGAGQGGVSPPPASISVLSGDVHHSYAARAVLGPEVVSPVHQLTCSPVHNDMPRYIRPAMKFGWNAPAAKLTRALARSVGLPSPPVRWDKTADPYFGNAVGVLLLDGRSAHVMIEGTRPDKTLGQVASLRLT